MKKFKRKLVLLTLLSSLTGVFASCGREDVIAGPKDPNIDEENKYSTEEFIEDSNITTSQDVVTDETEVTIPNIEDFIQDNTEVTEEVTFPTEIPTDSVPEDTEEQENVTEDPVENEEEEVVDNNLNVYTYTTITATTGVNVRVSPVDGEILALLPKGEKLTVIGMEDDWYKVIYNGYEAYVSSNYAYVSDDQDIYIPDEFENSIYEYDTITALANVNIRRAPVDGKVLGVLPYGKKLTLIGEVDGWYKVMYYGEEAYVSMKYAEASTSYSISGDVKKIMCATDELTIYLPYEVNESLEVALINSLECLEVYGETEDLYLVKTSDYVGYVKKNSLKEMTGTFVVVDISDQNLKLYVNNEVVVDTPVVTGHPNTPSDTGLFKINGIDRYRYLKGADYKAWVDIFMYYNGGEGLHDAEYHKCDRGGNHGWRTVSEFGGETYLSDGSHGCVNMLHDDVMEVAEHVKVGTPVLVKK